MQPKTQQNCAPTRCTTAEPTQPPRLRWHLCRMLWMALLTRGAACTLFSPWPAKTKQHNEQDAGAHTQLDDKCVPLTE